jgi:hypothetical protein
MEHEKLIREKVNCCITGKPMKDSKYLNFVQLHMKAGWEFPVWGNFITGETNMAVAYVHDDAIVKGKLIGKVKHAIEIKGDEVIYHEIQKCRICGCTEDDCSVCIKRTGSPCYWVEPDLCSACTKKISIYTIYDHPYDYPETYVIKKLDINDCSGKKIEPVQDPHYVFQDKDLNVVRNELIIRGFYNIGRQFDDDKVILESWI